jgi:hypothetical protein
MNAVLSDAIQAEVLSGAEIEPDCAAERATLAFFGEVRRAFRRADADRGVSRFYRVGGELLHLRFASPALLPRLAPALAHLAVAPPPPGERASLTLHIADSASTGVARPALPWTECDYGALGFVRASEAGRVRATYLADSDALHLFDAATGEAFYWVTDARELPAFVRAAPAATIFHWWAASRGRVMTHAAAVGTDAGGVLLAGRGGSGKSTTAFACLNSELGYASDDYCLVTAGPEPYAHSLFSAAKADARSRQLLSGVAAVESPDDHFGEKAIYFLHARCPQKITRGFPVKAVLLPHVGGGAEAALRPASSAEALRALAPSTIFQLPGANPRALPLLAELARRVPCFHLELGSDVSAAPRLIAAFLRGAWQR